MACALALYDGALGGGRRLGRTLPVAFGQSEQRVNMLAQRLTALGLTAACLSSLDAAAEDSRRIWIYAVGAEYAANAEANGGSDGRGASALLRGLNLPKTQTGFWNRATGESGEAEALNPMADLEQLYRQLVTENGAWVKE
jgi:hypothetical protein